MISLHWSAASVLLWVLAIPAVAFSVVFLAGAGFTMVPLAFALLMSAIIVTLSGRPCSLLLLLAMLATLEVLGLIGLSVFFVALT